MSKDKNQDVFQDILPYPWVWKYNLSSQSMANAINMHSYFTPFKIKDKTMNSFEGKF